MSIEKVKISTERLESIPVTTADAEASGYVNYWLGAVVSEVTVDRPLRARKPILRCLLSTLISRGTGITGFPYTSADARRC